MNGGYMGLFEKKRNDLPLLFSADELTADAIVNYDSVLEWLTGLSDDDYTKVCSVADIYRNANKDAADALGIEKEPSTFIVQSESNVQLVPSDINHIRPKTILDDQDDDINDIFEDTQSEFIADDQKTKTKQIEVASK